MFKTESAANDLKEWLEYRAPDYFDGHWEIHKVVGSTTGERGFQVFEFDNEGESWAIRRREMLMEYGGNYLDFFTSDKWQHQHRVVK